MIDRPKAYFPVPALKELEGATLDLVARRDLGRRPGPGPVPTRVRRHADAAPNEHMTTLGSSKLFQLALLELWLQAHGV